MSTFCDFNLDQRILKTIGELGWKEPTDIQQAVIPLFFQRKSLIVQAKTGSGKTAAYAIPLLQECLQNKAQSRRQMVSCVVMAPSKELCDQATKTLNIFIRHLKPSIRAVNISAAMSEEQMKIMLSDIPDIVVGTPARLLSHLQNETISLDHLNSIVIDEADLLFTFGHKEDLKAIKLLLPKRIIQVVLLSATLADTTKELRQTLVRGGEWMKVQLPDEPFLPSADKLTQYIVRSEEEDKFVILVALLQLKLLRGKTVIFVNSVDRCYKLKLFLDEFGIKSVILNSELPLSCRTHTLSQYNQGIYDIMIASDEAPTSTTKKGKQDAEYGVVRGLDFRLVSNVLNFDFPMIATQYVHRVGRTARADQCGTAMSLVSSSEERLALEVAKLLKNGQGPDPTIANIDDIFTPYQFKMNEIDGFRYRALDVKKKITKNLVREARLKEIKQELMNSERLKAYFQDHGADANALRHDKPLVRSVNKNLKHLPEYLVPESLRQLASSSKASFQKQQKKNNKYMNRKPDQMRKKITAKKRAVDPLRTTYKKQKT
ncbi:putative ATP-dependent RNA helicase ddx56 [Cichlidogyrus casuarinus]|uniref:RNA helicase n=1 Tax=Cichlidogyrus casuarinus TaxID=1844966 RepID=A0ABD2QDL2_9PLAT